MQVFRDEGYSGATLRRPGLDRLRDQAANGSFDQVIFTAPDRLARKYVHQMLLIEELEGHGCHVHFLERPMSEDPNDQLLLPWTRPPYGYRLDPDHPRNPAGVRVEEAEGAIVSEVFARYVQPGQSLSSLSTYLKQLNVATPTGKKRWSNGTLRRILSNPVYTGVIYAGRGRVQPAKRRRSALAPVGQRGTTSMPTSPDQWMVVGHIAALVTQDRFEQVQAKLKTNQQFARRNNRAHTYLLRALASCGCCHLACTGQTRRSYSYYTCVGKSHPSRSGREEKCCNRLIPMKQLDAVVWADLCDLLTHPESIRQALERSQSGEWLPQELQARREGQRKARVTLSHQIDRLTEAYLERIVTLEEYRRRRRELEERQEAIEAQVRRHRLT